MLTEIHHSTNRQLLFSFPEGSGDLADQRYALGLTICDNPVCDCSSLYFTLSPWRSAPDDDPDADSDADPDADPDADLDSDSDSDSVEHSEQPVKFAIDINSRELDIQNSPQAEARSIGTTFVETLSEEDWSLLTQAFYQYKRKATDETPDDDIKAEFPADEIERDSTMISFRSILPYAESKILDQDDQRFLVDDLYCVKAKCNCTDIVVRLLDTAMNVDTDERITYVPTVAVNYHTGTWRIMDEGQFARSFVHRIAEQLKSADLLSFFRARHARLRALYRGYQARNPRRAIPMSARPRPSVGRNDPCPCGSGKKYKKCCLDNPTASWRG